MKWKIRGISGSSFQNCFRRTGDRRPGTPPDNLAPPGVAEWISKDASWAVPFRDMEIPAISLILFAEARKMPVKHRECMTFAETAANPC